MAAEDRQSGREKEKQETQEMERERERAQRAQQREKEQRERDTEQKEHRLLEKQLERERHMNELVVNLLNEIKLLKTTTRQLRGESGVCCVPCRVVSVCCGACASCACAVVRVRVRVRSRVRNGVCAECRAPAEADRLAAGGAKEFAAQRADGALLRSPASHLL
jgi:hypothetical protein